MGYAVWLEEEVAWAAGTYEYRPFGVAVISATDLFRQRDFRRDRQPPPESAPSFAGYFASLGEVNAFLVERRKRTKLQGLERRSDCAKSP